MIPEKESERRFDSEDEILDRQSSEISGYESLAQEELVNQSGDHAAEAADFADVNLYDSNVGSFVLERFEENSGSKEEHFEDVSLNETHSGRSSTRDSISSITIPNSSNVSPWGSPHRRAALPDASPELMRLIDSAIQGADQKTLQKLKQVVAERHVGEEPIKAGKIGEEVSQVKSMNGSVHDESINGKREESIKDSHESIKIAEDSETCGRLVVEILLAKMGGIEGIDDGSAPKMMLSAGAAIVAGELIPWLSYEPRTRLAKGISTTLLACTRNRAMCSAAGLLVVLLDSARTFFSCQDEWDSAPLLEAIEALGTHSLSVSDLRHWLSTVTEVIHTGKSLDLLVALEKTMTGEETRGPSHTFEFDGESSGLLGPGESKWPFVNGYAFATWIYIESFADTLNAATAAAAIAAAAAAKTGKSSAMSAAAAASALAGEGTAHMPRLFSFLSADNQGVEAYFHGQFLVVESASSKGSRKSSLHFTYAFKPRRWYFVGIEHVFKQSLMGKGESEVRLYVDGRLYEGRPFEFPRVSKPLAFCCIGTNPPPAMAGLQRRRRQCPLFAEVGPVYIFKEPVGPDKMSRLAARGGDMVPTFGNLEFSKEDSSVLDSEIAPKVHLLYHPKLLAGRSCMDISPSGASGLHRRPAEILGHVHVASRMKPVEAVWAMGEGGPLALLPLVVGSVNKETFQPNAGDKSLSLKSALLAVPVLRILSAALKHPGNADEMIRGHASNLLAHLLAHLLAISSISKSQESDEELVAAVASLCQAPKDNPALKVQLYSSLLLDLKLWCRCTYGLQKKLLSSLADMVFTEETTMRAANAVQMLLDGCRCCYWVVPEPHSAHLFAGGKSPRPLGEINALVDELFVIVELLVGSAHGSVAVADLRSLVQFVLDCPQSNQVARILHLMYRLVVQPNATRAASFAELLMSNGAVEMLLTLIQRESEMGENTGGLSLRELDEEDSEEIEDVSEVDRMSVESETPFLHSLPSQKEKNLGGISLSIIADSAKNNFRNIDKGDGIMLGIVSLLGALLVGDHLKSSTGGAGTGEPPGLASWVFYALQRAFQAAPKRLLTRNVYSAVLSIVVRSEGGTSSTEDGLAIFDTVHRFEHRQLFLALLRALPYAPRDIQLHALQDILLLACTHHDNRTRLTAMPEWPEWLLEVLMANYEVALRPVQDELEELIYSFLTIMLEHSMRCKDGWKDIEAAIHCAEWLAVFGGQSTGDQRLRREEALPVFKRRLLGALLDFAGRELQKQTDTVAKAAARVAGLSPRAAKAEAEEAAHLSMSLAENSVVLLMLVEDHLRQHQNYNSSQSTGSRSVGSMSPRGNYSFSAFGRTSFDGSEALGGLKRLSSSSDSGLSMDYIQQMADSNGQVSVNAFERLAAAAAAEPYESVRCAFASYGSCGFELAEGWKTRSRMWYGVGLPANGNLCGGGGGGIEAWNSILERDAEGKWIEYPLVNKCINMLQALLMDEFGPGGAAAPGYGGGAGSGVGGVHALHQLLDSDQPFYAMLRMVLLALREEDHGEEEHSKEYTQTKALLWSVLSQLLTMPLSESKRQRVLVTSSILYSEVYHAISADRKFLKKKYVRAIMPCFTALLRKWRPLLSGVHELTDADGQSPLAVEDRSLATDADPEEAALDMITPSWASAFASPPVAMALAMAAAGAAGGESSAAPKGLHVKRESSNVERKFLRFRTFSGFQKQVAVEPPAGSTLIALPEPKDKAGAKAAALAAAREQERAAKIGSGRGLAAVAMATSSQRRAQSNKEREQRAKILDLMNKTWLEFFSNASAESSQASLDREISKVLDSLSAIVSTTRTSRSLEVERRLMVIATDAFGLGTGSRAWRALIRRLLELECLFGPVLSQIRPPRIFWKLDAVENTSRMRKRLKRNYKGSDHHGAAADYREPENPDTAKTADDLLSAGALALVPESSEEITSDLEEGDFTSFKQREYEQMSAQAAEFPLASPGHTIAPQSKERLLLEVAAVMVQPLKTVKGLFQVTTKHIFFITDVETQQEAGKAKLWHLSSLKEVHSRRYLLRKSALELFMLDMSNHFFDFESAIQKNRVYRAIVQARPPHLNTIYAATQKPEWLMKRTQLMEQWAHRQISNFEYLMRLNTLAGRTYNDITQYPVFPWILSDYTSKDLNLDDPSIYRDLSKPIGALSPSRLEKILERYHNFDDPVIPKFHYGSHYSSAGTVVYYLTRIEPFASLAIELQGGKFDHADRMFSDIGSTWNGVLEDMSDVKELVPEFFYMPEILTNDNGFDLGRTQLGEQLGNVKLPSWARSPVDFVHKHRQALESEYVSAHLHEWIDLIFGFKQRGRDAVAAHNIFFYTTYEGALDVDKITDPGLRKATQDQIKYFGQTPSQLLKTPHMKRIPLNEFLHLQTIFRNPKSTVSYALPEPEKLNVPAAKICAAEDSIVAVDFSAPSCHVAMHRWQPNTPDNQGAPFLFQHAKFNAGSNGGSLMRMFRGQNENYFPRASGLPGHGIRSDSIVAVSSTGRLLFTGGHADNSFKLFTTDNARLLESAYGHCKPITCIALSADGTTIITGSQDCTAILWRLHSNALASNSGLNHTQLSTGPDSTGTSSEIKRKRIETIHILRGHVDELTCCCVDSSQDIAVTYSHNLGFLLLHSVAKGRIIRRIYVDRADTMALSSEGIIVVWDRVSRRLRCYTINGLEIASRTFSAGDGDISCIVTSTDGQHIVVGTAFRRVCPDSPGSGGLHHRHHHDDSAYIPSQSFPCVMLLDIYTLEVIYTFRLHENEDVTAMALNKDNTNLIVSTADAQLLLFTDPALSIRVVDQMLRIGWEGSGLSGFTSSL